MLAWSTNLGHVDVYPATSGKKNAGLYLAAQLLDVDQQQHELVDAAAATSEGQQAMALSSSEAAGAATAFLCDDDNDLGLASAVGLVLVPQCTSESVAAAAAAHRLPAETCGSETAIFGEAASGTSHNHPLGEPNADREPPRSPSEFLVAPVGGCLGTEWCLREALARANAHRFE